MTASLDKACRYSLSGGVHMLDRAPDSVGNALTLLYALRWVPRLVPDHDMGGNAYMTTNWVDSGADDGEPAMKFRLDQFSKLDRLPARFSLGISVPEPLLRARVHHTFWLQDGELMARGSLVRQARGSLPWRMPFYGEPHAVNISQGEVYDWPNFFYRYSPVGDRFPSSMFMRDESRIVAAMMVLVAWLSEEPLTDDLPGYYTAGERIAELASMGR